ncbi:hypothetical protein ACFTSF_01890 [Kribbella sp. NPDC056951]|uniref:hypothetical protein n=1 Tax=Kribbella sp. NPDC056951 TaxID=3345978 RepID=UPI003635B2A1
MTTPDTAAKTAVLRALQIIQTAFPDWTANTCPDGQGGLWVELTGVPLGLPYAQDDTFLVFLLPFTLPSSDIYPMFLRADLSRLDGASLGEGFAVTQLSWPAEQAPRPVVQVSRRTRGSFAYQTAAQKVSKVLDWVMTR